MKKGTLVLFRHGQTEYNKLHYLTGLHDVALTETGEEQARTAGKAIAAFSFDKVYSSTLSRAYHTARLALENAGAANGKLAIERHPLIVEADSGDFSGRNKFTDPEIFAYPHKYDVALPNGESDRQMVTRVQKFYDEELMPRLARGETVLVVSHSGIMVAFDIVAGLKPVPVEDIWSNRSKVPNAAPLVFAYEDGKLINHYRMQEVQQSYYGKIVRPTPEQLKLCYDLELSFATDRAGAEDNGFFLPGVPYTLYEDLLATGYMRCIPDGHGKIASYIVAVPPGHDIVRRMLSGKDSLIMSGDKPDLNPANTLWIAKIATSLPFRRKGYAAALYRHAFRDFPGMTAFTATALSPLRNKASEFFHKNQGLHTCGVFLSGKKGNIDNIVNLVWKKNL